ncbi:MAG TPA: hypothetical protein VLV49_04720 [Terriglobales bacterium]|nr:hypothetical protein [Terriglobales bacterium]
MQSLAVVRCSGCGQENSSQYRFCGMCGLPLPRAEAKAEPSHLPAVPRQEGPRPNAPAPPLAVNRVSLLGLEEEPLSSSGAGSPRPDADYLLEEIKQPHSARMHLALVVLAAAALLIVWKWRHEGYPWAPSTQQAAQIQGMQSPKPAAAIEAPSTPAEAPATAQSPTPAASEVPKPSEKPATVAEKPAATPASPEASAPSSIAKQDQAKLRKPSPSKEAAVKAEPPKPALLDVARTQAAAQPASEAADAETQLLLEGEKYLYGNGAPQDCARAQKSLLAAAAHSSTAESLLGTMYASGHCAPHDLPTAYHWYARALSHDPDNTRIESDLKVLWMQMTPAERQLAGGK